MAILISQRAATLRPSALSDYLVKIAPGIALCAAVTLAAVGLQTLERRAFGHVWLESLVLAIVLGAVLRAFWAPGRRWRPGVQFSAKTLLELAVVLLGASVSAATILAVGPLLLAGIALVVTAALASSYGLGRLLGLSPRMATLVACGNSICGNSAIAAVAPVIGADGDDVTASIAFTAVLGVAVVLGLPFLGLALHMSSLQFGALAGLTVYAVPQVLAATTAMGTTAVQFGTLVKLVRVLMLGPVCLALSLVFDRNLARSDRAKSLVPDRERSSQSQRRLSRFVPWFIIGFLIMVAARSLGCVPASASAPITILTMVLTIVSMAALGLSTDVKTVARSGARVSASVLLSLIFLAAMSLGLIFLLRLS